MCQQIHATKVRANCFLASVLAEADAAMLMSSRRRELRATGESPLRHDDFAVGIDAAVLGELAAFGHVGQMRQGLKQVACRGDGLRHEAGREHGFA